MVSVGMAGGDPGRIAAQVVTGIGFLGAGAILRGPQGLTGITTAATIWAVAAGGMMVGVGYAGAGMALSIGVLAILSVAAAIESRYLGPCRFEGVEVVFAPDGGKTEVRIQSRLADIPGIREIAHRGNHDG